MADRFGRLDILLDVLDRSQLKLLTVVGRTVTKLAPTPGTITNYPDQQRITSALARRSDGTNFKGIGAQVLHITLPQTFRLFQGMPCHPMIADLLDWTVPQGYYNASSKGISQLPEKGIATSLLANGGLGSMPGQYNCLFRQNK